MVGLRWLYEMFWFWGFVFVLVSRCLVQRLLVWPCRRCVCKFGLGLLGMYVGLYVVVGMTCHFVWLNDWGFDVGFRVFGRTDTL